MYYDRTDEYGFNSSLECDSLPIELSCGCEDQPSPKEEICLAPEEQNAPEYGTSSKRSDEQNGEDIYETVKKAIFTLKPIKMSGGEYSTGEFVEYTVTEQLPDGTSRQTIKTVKDIAKETGKSLYDYSVVGSNSKPSKHVVFTPSK